MIVCYVMQNNRLRFMLTRIGNSHKSPICLAQPHRETRTPPLHTVNIVRPNRHNAGETLQQKLQILRGWVFFFAEIPTVSALIISLPLELKTESKSWERGAHL